MIRRKLILALLTCFVSGMIAFSLWATHFRYGHYTWTQAGGNSVQVSLRNAFRRSGDPFSFDCVDPSNPTLPTVPCSGTDGLPAVGDVFPETIGGTTLNWGDGSPPVGSAAGPLLYVVTSIDPDDWLFAQALDPTSLPQIDTTLSHTFSSSGDFVAFTESCCRISAFDPPDVHINNPDGPYRVETIVNAGGTNNSPQSALPPIVTCPIDGLCEFLVLAVDPDGDQLTFRLATSVEASGTSNGFVQPGPPFAPNAATIDPVSGIFSWDTTGATLAEDADEDGIPDYNTLYSTQVVIEDGQSKVALDFFICVCALDPDPPCFCDADPQCPGCPDPDPDEPPVCNTTQVVNVNNTLTFVVTASDPDPDDVVTLGVASLCLGAQMNPPLPLSGNPISSTFSWTPGPDDIGECVVAFDATSSSGGFAICSVAIVVQPAQPFLRGDCNDDGLVNIADGIYILNHLWQDGPEGHCAEACNANGVSTIDISDAIWIFTYRLLDGLPPPTPFPDCDSQAQVPCEFFNSCP